MIIGIVAISQNSAIGKDGKLPWHYSHDLRFFKETTTGHIVVMGSTTWNAIGKPLPNRLNIVLSRSGRVETPETVLRLGSTSEVIELAKYTDRDVFIIGGAKTYAAFADAIYKWIVTEIPETVADADTFLPRDYFQGFEVERSVELDDGLWVRFMHRI